MIEILWRSTIALVRSAMGTRVLCVSILWISTSRKGNLHLSYSYKKFGTFVSKKRICYQKNILVLTRKKKKFWAKNLLYLHQIFFYLSVKNNFPDEKNSYPSSKKQFSKQKCCCCLKKLLLALAQKS